jgi:hypothetical protein
LNISETNRSIESILANVWRRLAGESAGCGRAVVVAHGRPVNGGKTVAFRATLTPANQS